MKQQYWYFTRVMDPLDWSVQCTVRRNTWWRRLWYRLVKGRPIR